MGTEWEMVQSDPAGAEQTVLLLPGGMCSARSYAEVMAEPALARTRLLAVTMPGHAGAPPPRDFSTESYARITAELAQSAGVDVVVGFSMGAMVAYEMVVSGAFTGPVVLLGASLSEADEPRFYRPSARRSCGRTSRGTTPATSAAACRRTCAGYAVTTTPQGGFVKRAYRLASSMPRRAMAR
jgi:pimeloyl-ACP methyl ester carboxylesterase